MSGAFMGLPGQSLPDDALPAPVGIPDSVEDAQDLRAALRAATAQLRHAKVESARNDAEVLAAHLLGVDRGRLAVMALMGEAAPEGYAELIEARTRRVPLQHLVGSAPFRHLELKVGPGVFTPRPETELVAGAAIEAAQAMKNAGVNEPLVLDLCTGSGAIAAAVATEVPGAKVIAVELSESALVWAKRNLKSTNVELIHSDALSYGDALLGRVDVLVSNPPYVPNSRHHGDPEVGTHDPVEALYGGGEDGMEFPTALLARAAKLLRAGGDLVMEHDETQSQAMLSRLAAPTWADAVVHQDLTGRPRYTTAKRTHHTPNVGE